MASYSININSFRSVLDLNRFIDFLISKKFISRQDYELIRSKEPEDRLNYIISIVDNHVDYTRILQELLDWHPNIMIIQEEDHKYHEALVRGGFPKLPMNYVKRTSLAENLANKIRNLKPRETLLVHGMMGCGKTFLVTQILNDKVLVKNYFDYKIFWVNLGEHHNLDNILATMWRLYSMAITAIKGNPISHCPDQCETLKQLIKNIFQSPEMQNALVILDDAGSEEVIAPFDFGCKTIITTKNKKIVSDEYAIFVEVNSAFTEEETLEMFSYLGNTKKIQHELLAICEMCKRFPLYMATISSFLKENEKDVGNPSVWEYIKTNLEMENSALENAIKMCIDNLSDQLKSKFYDLSIFQQDVNIITEVLQILWQVDPFKVRNIMKQLEDRSLVVSFYHNDRKSYVYGVHDVFLNYLKKVTNGNRFELHRKLINGYNRVTNGNYLLLPNDNYTLQYIGYHLKEADETDKFQIFLNLKFIEAKIRAAGHADVLRDMNTYGIYIYNTKYNDYMTKYNDYMRFVDRFGKDIFYNDKIDIVQFALQENEDSAVYKDALDYAHKHPNLLYFKIKPPTTKTTTPVHKDKNDIISACYLNGNAILLGLSTGEIELFENGRKLYSLKEHTEAVTSLIPNHTKSHVISISEDKSVRLWKLKPSRKSWDADARDRQLEWINIHYSESSITSTAFDLKNTEEHYTAANFSPDFHLNNLIAIGNTAGIVSIWNTVEPKFLTSTGGPRGLTVKNLMFVRISNADDGATYVVFSLDSSIFIYNFDQIQNKLHYYAQLINTEVPIAMFLCKLGNDVEVTCVNKNCISVWPTSYKLNISRKNYQISMNNESAIITDDCKYLVVSTSEKSLFVWDNEHKKMMDIMHYGGLTKLLDTHHDEHNSAYMLLISSDRKTLQQCAIRPNAQIANNINFPVFSSYWNKSAPLTAVRGKTNKIQIYHDHLSLVETNEISDSITFTKLCDDTTVIFGLVNGEVLSFNIKTRQMEQLTKLDGPITHIEVYGSIKNMNTKILIVSKQDILTLWCNGNTISQKFYMPKLYFNKNLLFVVEGNGNISSWDTQQNKVNVGYKNPKSVDIITATICPHKKQLALCGKESDIYFVAILEISDNVKINAHLIDLKKYIEIGNQPTFACYSFDGSLLAIGMISGDIQVWDTRSYMCTTLKLHEAAVEFLLFSPEPELILVSLGDQIGWWNLKQFKQMTKSEPSPNNLETSHNILTTNNSYWSSKEGLGDGHYRVACIKLHEQYAKIISASPDFTSFLTVDGTGRIYIMRVV